MEMAARSLDGGSFEQGILAGSFALGKTASSSYAQAYIPEVGTRAMTWGMCRETR